MSDQIMIKFAIHHYPRKVTLSLFIASLVIILGFLLTLYLYALSCSCYKYKLGQLCFNLRSLLLWLPGGWAELPLPCLIQRTTYGHSDSQRQE